MNKSLIACSISDSDQIAFLALNTGDIIIYNLQVSQAVFSFKAHQDEHVVHLQAISTENGDFLLVVCRTSCILYLLQNEGVERLCSYFLNTRIKQNRRKYINAFSYVIRHYFTSAKVVAMDEPSNSKIEKI
jgi:hypothetical protein